MFGQFVVHLDYMLSAPTACQPHPGGRRGASRRRNRMLRHASRRASWIQFHSGLPEAGHGAGPPAMAKTHGSGEFSVTEENARQGDTGPTEASPAGEPDRPPVPAAPSQPTASPPASIPVPPHPSTPPPVPPVDREDSREESRNPSGAKRTALGVGGAGLSGIGKMLAQQAALLGGWVRRQGLPRVAGAVAGLAVLGLLIWWVSSSLGGGARPAAGEASWKRWAPWTSGSVTASRILTPKPRNPR
jgi:hypothetical protein